MKKLSKNQKKKINKTRSSFINYRLKHTKFRLKDIVKFLYNNEICIGIITEISFIFGKPCYTINSLDFKKCYYLCSKNNILSKIKRYHYKLKRVKHLFKIHTLLKINISDNFVSEYCKFYGDDPKVFSKELRDRNISGIIDAEILNYYVYSKSYDVFIGDDIVLHEKLLLKFLL